MERLENRRDKKSIVQDFFNWVFDKDDIKLFDEVDLSLAHQYYDPNIYYPEPIASFFNTKAMKRLGRISQLGLMVSENKNCYHNRLEHSKGTYNRKLEELIYLTSNETYKKFIEDNNLKLYLLAELVKEAAHDIGHLPLSHIMEIKVIGRRDFHEDIGKRILLENEEIAEVLQSINPEFKSILKKLINEDSLNLKTHDEGNYDVDRLDYLLRDSLYNGNQIEDYYHEQYQRQYAKIDENGNIMKNRDGSIILVDLNNKTTSKRRIDIYENSSLSVIEKFLETRIQAYRSMYFSESIQVRDSLVGNFVNDVLKYSTDDVGKELKSFIGELKQKDVNIDIEEYLKWDDIKFYDNCFDIAQNTTDEALTQLSGMIIPNIESLMYLTFSHLDLSNARKNNFDNLSKEDKDFIQKVKALVYSDTDLSKMLKDKDYYEKNRLMTFGEDNICELREKYKDIISYSKATVYGYNSEIPIYIKDKEGKVYSLHEHPERSRDWKNRKETISVAFTTIPELKLQGLSAEKIEEIKQDFIDRKPDIRKETFEKKTNMQPLKVDSKIEDYFEI